MEASAAYFGFRWDRFSVARVIKEKAATLGPEAHKLRVTVSRLGAVEVETTLLPNGKRSPLVVTIDPSPVRSDNVFLFHKTTNRREYDVRRARYPGIDEVLLVNQRGEVTEATASNILVKIDGHLYTPPLDSGCLPGIYREVLLSDGSVTEEVIRVDDLDRAEEISLVNSVRLRRTAVLLTATAAGEVVPMRIAE